MKIIDLITAITLAIPPLFYFIVLPIILKIGININDHTINLWYWITFVDYVFVFGMMLLGYSLTKQQCLK
jgi:hypothetical protein